MKAFRSMHRRENTASGRDRDAMACQGRLDSTSRTPGIPPAPTNARKVVPLINFHTYLVCPPDAMIITSVEPFLVIPFGLGSLVMPVESDPGEDG